jgi:hypothetical protein
MLRATLAICGLLLLSACGSTDAEVTRERDDDGDKLPYPSRILVYDFAVSPTEVPADSAAAGRLTGAEDDPQSNPQRQSLEHQIADVVANRVVAELQELDLPAMRWRGPAPAGNNIYTLEGQFLTIDEGNAMHRMIIGFGVGGTELRVLVQACRVDAGRKELLGEAEVSSESSSRPGLAATLPVGAAMSGIATAAAVQTGVGVVTEMNTDVRQGAEDTAEAIIDLLKPRMEDQGWFDD